MKSETPNLYSVLGITEDASQTAIKRAYKKLSMSHHPDRGGHPESFKKIKLAYEVLSDPEKKARYDNTGDFEVNPAASDDQLAKNIIMAYYLEEAMKGDLKANDYMTKVGNRIVSQKAELMMAVLSTEEKILKCGYLADNTTGIISEMMADKAKSFSSHKAQLDSQLSLADKALEIIPTFDYTGVIPEPEMKPSYWDYTMSRSDEFRKCFSEDP